MPCPRSTYRDALDPEGDFCDDIMLDRLRAEVRGATGGEVAEVAGHQLPELVRKAAEWSTAEAERFGRLPVTDGGTLARAILLNCAPLGLVAGGWLQWMSCAANAETELSLRIMALYADDLGVGAAHADRGSAYVALMRRYEAAEGASTAARLPSCEGVGTGSFRFPGLLLQMSRRPDDFTPELLGADLCLRSVGVLPPVAGYEGVDLTGGTGRGLDLADARDSGGVPGLAGSLESSTLFLDGAEPGEKARLRAGFDWTLAELSDWCDELAGELDLASHPAYDMWRLMCNRASQAAVYHAKFTMEGAPLSEWFEKIDEGPEPFLRALAASKLVKAGAPDRSSLIRGLIGERGPMFRVFTDEDVAVIRRWIASLPETGEQDDSSREYYERLHAAQAHWYRHHEHADSRRAADADASPTRRSPAPAVPTTVREAYHVMLRRQDTPELREYARAYTQRWLARARYRMDSYEDSLPPVWEREIGLRPWLEAQHRRQGSEFNEGDQDRVPPRDKLIDSTVQTAPLTLIDGGWIQGFTDFQLASTEIGYFLFETYWDELGNGEVALNHPKIYRDLLRQMGVDLPPTGSPEFARWDGFRDESFELPVYWLCISRFPRSHMPEILGLNLAMELSGVGGSYRSARRGLKHHGFSTQFVDIHNTIDNVSTGHSAWAVHAVDNYMHEVPNLMGAGMEPVVWERIRAGYRSLKPPKGLLPSWYGWVTRTMASRGRTAATVGGRS